MVGRDRTRALHRLLTAVAGRGTTVRIIYHGGRQPGALRTIRPLRVTDAIVLAEDLGAGLIKPFRLDRIEWPTRQRSAPAYLPPEAIEGTHWVYMAVEDTDPVNPDGQARQALLRDQVRPGQRVRLVRDRDAVPALEVLAVHLKTGERIGRLSWEASAEMLARLQAGYHYVAFVHHVTGDGPGEGPRRLVLRVVEAIRGVSPAALEQAVQQATAAPDAGAGAAPSWTRWLGFGGERRAGRRARDADRG